MVISFDVIPFKISIEVFRNSFESFEDMNIYVDKVEKPDEHPVNALRETSLRSGKNGNLNRRGMSNNDKTCF